MDYNRRGAAIGIRQQMNTSRSVPPPAGTNPLAITSLVAALVAWVGGGGAACLIGYLTFGLGVLCGLPIFTLGNIVATVTGHIAQAQIEDAAGAQSGGGLALTGIILGWIGNVLSVLGLLVVPILVIALALAGPAIGNVLSNIVQDLVTATPAP